ncbi:MAG: HlyD family efflux transporter periplasmic adaptor subunit [Planctomycetota bacterium]|jgi:multidrug efflux pump subunit AcrA (membrane-fusion protein)|nr:HlyD family efflux transporter periplasmic adaptor subunit [Planctomycetota bacterium]
MMRSSLTCLAIACFTLALPAEDQTWQPDQHPAVIEQQLHGVTRPVRMLDLAAEVSARLSAISVAQGHIIKDDEPLLHFDQTLSQIAVDRAQAAIAEAEARRATAAAEHKLAAREADYQLAEQARIDALIADGRLSQREQDASRFTAESAALRRDLAAAGLASAEASVVSAQVALREAQEHLARHYVSAPQGWVVSTHLLEPGTMVAAGTPVVRLHDVSELNIELRLSEEEIRALGTAPELHFADFDTTATASVQRIAVDFDPTSRKRLVVLRIPGDAAPIASGGLFVTLRLMVPLSGGGVLVPKNFILRGRDRIFVERDDGTRIAVVPITERGDYVVLTSSALPAGTILQTLGTLTGSAP